MLRFVPTVKSVVTFILGLAVGLGLAIWWSTAPAASSLTAKLPSNWQVASTIFDTRLRARFPIGTSAWTFINDLRQEGFEPTWFEGNGQYGAKRLESGFPCKIVARVYWRIGKDGAVTAVRGLYREEGCL